MILVKCIDELYFIGLWDIPSIKKNFSKYEITTITTITTINFYNIPGTVFEPVFDPTFI